MMLYTRAMLEDDRKASSLGLCTLYMLDVYTAAWDLASGYNRIYYCCIIYYTLQYSIEQRISPEYSVGHESAVVNSSWSLSLQL